MMPQLQAPPEIISFCERCSERLRDVTEDGARVEIVQAEFPHLLRNKPLFAQVVGNIVEGAKYPDLRHATMFDNEVLLYADPARRFSLRMFFWEPGHYMSVHDHNSWGVIGAVSGRLEVICYRREDDGSRDDYARLAESERVTLSPGETASTLPLEDGIHKIGNPTSATMISLSLYGNPLPRGYIRGFDVESGRVYRILAPKIRKKLLAIGALPGLDKSARVGALKSAGDHPLEIIRSAASAPSNKLE